MAIPTSSTMTLANQGGATIFQWINGATVTASDATAPMPGINILSQATLFLNVTSVTGTAPTLDLYLQKLLADGSTWHDIAHFAQATAAGRQVLSMVTGGNKIETQQSNALTASTVNSVPFGATWRLSAVVGGTSPSITFSVWMEGLT